LSDCLLSFLFGNLLLIGGDSTQFGKIGNDLHC